MKKKKKMLVPKLCLFLTLLSFSLIGWAQQNIKGKVVDSDGQTLPGVTVVVQGTNNGTVTDIDGLYTISAPANAALKFSFIGFITVIEDVKGRTSINVTMQIDATGIEEVVAVGYGTMKKVDITGAVSSVKGADIAASGAFSAGQAMQGKLSGVTVVGNGDAGSDAKIRIRGIRTIGNNEPLIVVDGITNGAGLGDLNPADIASIDVLKDASALAIYGSRASNGVILITTKTGSYGKQELQVSLNVSYGVANVYQRLDLTTPEEKVAMIDEALINEKGAKAKTYDNIFFLKNALGKDSLAADGKTKVVDQWGRQNITDWQDELFNTGIVQDYALSVVGGSQNAKYAFSVAYRDQKGTLPGNFAKRYVFRGSTEAKVMKDKLKIGSTFNYSIREDRGSQQGDLWSSDLFSAAVTPGNIPAYFPEGSPYAGAPYQETDPARLAYFRRGATYENSGMIYDDISNPKHKMVTTLYADLEIIKGLNFKSVLGQNYSQNYSRSYSVQSMNPLSDKASELTVSSGRNMSTSLDNTLTYDGKVGMLKIVAMLGTNTLDATNNSFKTFRNIFPEGDIEGLRYLEFGSPENVTNNETASNYRLASYFGRVNMNYADKYLLTATVRRDASSRFHKSVRWGSFPSLSAGWRISEEDFLSSATWLEYLKIRASWGKVGNQNVGRDYAYLSSVTSGFSEFTNSGSASKATDAVFGNPGTRNIGKLIYQRGNESVTWETTTMQNIGVDFSFIGISGSVEAFQNNTTGMLLDAQYPQIVGYYPGSSIKINAGEVETKGIEFSLSYAGKKGDFSYNVGTSFTYSDNKVISLSGNKYYGDGADAYKNQAFNMSRFYVGDAIGSFYGHNIVGIFNTQEEVDAANQKYRDMLLAKDPNIPAKTLSTKWFIASKTAPGDYIFEDINGDGTITGDDVKNLGSGNPRVQFGLNFSCNYKAIDFAMNLTGVTGVEIYSMLEAPLSISFVNNSLASVKEHWTPENHTDVNPRYSESDPNKNLRPSSKYIHDGSYLRVSNLVLGYTLPENLVSKIGLSKLRVFANVQNLYTLTNYPFLDPEVRGSDTGKLDTAAGVDTGSSPNPTTVMFGLNVNF